MKKFNFKTLIILMMVLVLAFALVACGDKDPNPDGPDKPDPPVVDEFTAADYFTTLWDLSGDIGGDTIGDKDNVAIHAGLEVGINLVNSLGKVQQGLDLGIGLDLVLDRNPDNDGTNGANNATALRINAYDPTGDNFATAYFFMNDPYAIYFDYAGQNLKLEFDYKNDTFLGSFNNLVFNDKLLGGKTINDLLTAFTKDMGANWSLDTLISSVLGIFDLDVSALEQYNETAVMVVGAPLVKDGKLNIKDILTSDTASNLFVNSKTATKDGTTVNKTEIDSEILTFASGLVDSLLPGLGDLLKGLKLGLEYSITDNALDYFVLNAELSKVTAKDVNGKEVHPAISLKITDLEIGNAGNDEIKLAGDNYSTDLYFDNKIDLALDGLTLNLGEVLEGAPTLVLEDTTLTLGLVGKLDLKNVEDNGTAANLFLAINGAHLIDLTYNNGILGLAVNRDVKIGDVAVIDTIVALGGPALKGMMDSYIAQVEQDPTVANGLLDILVEAVSTGVFNEDWTALDDNFKGVVLTNIDLVPLFQTGVDAIINMIFPAPAPNPAAPAAAFEDGILAKVIDTIKYIIPIINTEDDALTLGGEDLMKTVIKVFRQFNGAIYNNSTGKNDAEITEKGIKWIVDRILEADKSNMLATVMKVIDIGLADGATGADFLTAIFTDLEGYLTLDLGDNGALLAANLTVNGDVKVGLSLTSTVKTSASLVDIGAVYAQDPTGFVAFDLAELLG